MRPPLMGNMMRGSVPQGPTTNRPPFPNPIQRPGGMPSSSTRGPVMLPSQPMGPPGGPAGQGGQGPKGNNQNPGGNNANPASTNINAMKLGGNTLFNNMLFNAASMLTVSSQLGLQMGPNNGSNPFAMKGPGGMGGYNGGPPNRESGPRPGPPLPSSHQNIKPGSGPPVGNMATTNSKPPGSYPGPSNIKAQQAQQRQALLNHAANFLNNKGTNVTKSTKASNSANTGSSVNSPTESKKPPLAMVSNPGLVGTSVKIDLGASSNSRAPAVSSDASVPSSTSTTVGSNKASASTSMDAPARASVNCQGVPQSKQ